MIFLSVCAYSIKSQRFTLHFATMIQRRSSSFLSYKEISHLRCLCDDNYLWFSLSSSLQSTSCNLSFSFYLSSASYESLWADFHLCFPPYRFDFVVPNRTRAPLLLMIILSLWWWVFIVQAVCGRVSVWDIVLRSCLIGDSAFFTSSIKLLVPQCYLDMYFGFVGILDKWNWSAVAARVVFLRVAKDV